MRVLYVANPFSQWPVAKETTAIMAREAQRRGDATFLCTHRDLTLVGTRPEATVQELRPLRGGAGLDAGDRQRVQLASFDVIHMRTDPPFDLSYYFATQVLELAAERSLVVNDPVSLRNLNEKLVILRFPDLICDTLVSADADEIAAFVRDVGGRAVSKPLYRCSGQGVRLLEGDGPDLPRQIALALADQEHLVVQRFLPGIVDRGETRLTVIGGRAAGWMRKIPKPGSILSNLDFGATIAPCELTPADERVMEQLGPRLREWGIHLAAVDIIDGYLSEVNLTSPGLLVEMNVLNGTQLEVELEDWLRPLIENKRGR